MPRVLFSRDLFILVKDNWILWQYLCPVPSQLSQGVCFLLFVCISAEYFLISSILGLFVKYFWSTTVFQLSPLGNNGYKAMRGSHVSRLSKCCAPIQAESWLQGNVKQLLILDLKGWEHPKVHMGRKLLTFTRAIQLVGQDGSWENGIRESHRF